MQIYSLSTGDKYSKIFIKLIFSDFLPGCIIGDKPAVEYNIFEFGDRSLLLELQAEKYDTYITLMIYSMYLKAKQKKNIWLSDYEKKLLKKFDESFQNQLIKRFPTLQLNVNFEPILEDIVKENKSEKKNKNIFSLFPLSIMDKYILSIAFIAIGLQVIYHYFN